MASMQFPAFYLHHASSRELSKQQFWDHASGISSDVATCKLQPILGQVNYFVSIVTNNHTSACLTIIICTW